MSFKIRPFYVGIAFFIFSLFSLSWFSLHPEELARPFAAKLVAVFCILFSIPFTYGCHLYERQRSEGKTNE